ncbi:hypothetical protein HanRHA438_Chr09g0388511 [Helianthus annuus]|nr:hypothetical protein HanRHA438_Chr09g0388511 [Helianthus annuus]KAJ0892223.1 hypothetical protein HanPSC8_Chr09g0363341 [Helianthus annuus]
MCKSECLFVYIGMLRNEDDAASWSSSMFFGMLKMDYRMLYFRCCCSKLDCIDLISRSTRVGCGFMSRICCLFLIYSLAYGRGLVRF